MRSPLENHCLVLGLSSVVTKSFNLLIRIPVQERNLGGLEQGQGLATAKGDM